MVSFSPALIFFPICKASGTHRVSRDIFTFNMSNDLHVICCNFTMWRGESWVCRQYIGFWIEHRTFSKFSLAPASRKARRKRALVRCLVVAETNLAILISAERRGLKRKKHLHLDISYARHRSEVILGFQHPLQSTWTWTCPESLSTPSQLVCRRALRVIHDELRLAALSGLRKLISHRVA